VAVERVNDCVRHLEAAVAAAQRQTEFAVSNPRGAGGEELATAARVGELASAMERFKAWSNNVRGE
jgi:hypothetical protein